MSNLNLQKLREFDRGNGPLKLYNVINYIDVAYTRKVCSTYA